MLVRILAGFLRKSPSSFYEEIDGGLPNEAEFPYECYEPRNLTALIEGEYECDVLHDYTLVGTHCWCPHATYNPRCEVEDAFVQYIDVVLCHPSVQNQEGQVYFIGMNILYTIWAAYLFLILGLTADAFFVPILTKISSLLNLR